MELPWQTNWTEKMKTNLTANRVLNTPIGHSDFFSSPVFDEKRHKITIGQFSGDFKEVKDADADDEKSQIQEIPQIINKQTHIMTESKYAANTEVFAQLRKMSDIDKYTPKDSIIFLDRTEIPVPEPEESDSYSIMNNMYVKDYLNINHPSIKEDWTGALTNKPLVIKPPPFFFSQ